MLFDTRPVEDELDRRWHECLFTRGYEAGYVTAMQDLHQDFDLPILESHIHTILDLLKDTSTIEVSEPVKMSKWPPKFIHLKVRYVPQV